jgi:hypothetical protein
MKEAGEEGATNKNGRGIRGRSWQGEFLSTSGNLLQR